MERYARTDGSAAGGCRRAGFAFAAVALTLLFSGCLNPLGSDNSAPGSQGTAAARTPGTLTVSIATLSGSTVAPGAGALAASTAYYSLFLEDPSQAFSPISVSTINPGSFPYTVPAVPATTWNLTITAFNSGGQAIGRSAVTAVDVTGGGTNVAISISAIQSGSVDGSLSYTISWPTNRVDVATVELYEVTNPTAPLTGGNPVTMTEGSDYNLDLAGGSLSISRPLPSGLYYLAIGFSFGGSPLPSVYEAVQIYDHLASSKSVTLTVDDFTEPPDAPTALTVAFTGEDTFNLSWTDNANMEQGYRVYFNPDFGTRFQLGQGFAGGTSSVTGLSTGEQNGTTGAIEVEAFNIYGTSTVLSQRVAIQPAGGTSFNLSGDLRTNDSSWAAAGDPGGIGWATLVPGGADSNELHLGTNQAAIAALSGTAAATNITPVFDLAGLQTYTRGTTYYWALAFRDGGNTVRGPVGSFTIRSADIYVRETGSADANAGSVNSPVATIVEAMSMVEAGETIHVAEGTYPGAISHLSNPVSVTLRGGYSPDFSSRTAAFDRGYPVTAGVGVSTIRAAGSVLSLTDIGPGEFVRVEGFHIQAGDDGVYFSGGGDALLRDSIIENGRVFPSITGFADAVRAENGGNLDILRNRFDLGPAALTAPDGVRSRALLVGAAGARVIFAENTVQASQAIEEITAIYGNQNATREFRIHNNQFQQMSIAAGSTRDGIILLAQGNTTGPRGEFRDNTVRLTGGSGPTTGLDLSSAGPFDVYRNRFLVDGAAVLLAATALELSQGSEPVNVYNNVMSLDSYTDTGRFVSISGQREANIDNNTFVASGAEPLTWNLLYKVAGTAAVNVRNNIARGFSTSTGQPIYTTTTTGLNIDHNLFWSFQPNGFFLGQVYQTVADLNALDVADFNVSVDPLLNGGADWALTGDSPIVARGGGVALPGVTDDFGSNGRTDGGTLGYSIGAHESDVQARFVQAEPFLIFSATATGGVQVRLLRGNTEIATALIDAAAYLGQGGYIPVAFDVAVTPGEELTLEMYRTNAGALFDTITYDGSGTNVYPWGLATVGGATGSAADVTFRTRVAPNLASGMSPIDQQQLARTTNSALQTSGNALRQTLIVGAPAP